MNIFQLFLIFIIGIIFSKTVYSLWESIFLFKKIDYYLYFFFCGVFVIVFLFLNFLLTFDLSEEAYLLINRCMLISQNVMMIMWIFAFYRKYFKESKIPFIFLITSSVLLSAIPFDIFVSSPAIFAGGNFFGSPFTIAFSTPNLMYYVYDINLFVFYSLITIIKFVSSGLNIKSKIISIFTFSPGVLFLIDAVAYIFIDFKYVDSNFWSGFYVVFLFVVFTTIFLLPNIESFIRVNDKISGMEEDNRILESMVEERTREIEDKNRQKTELFINLAHEFKTPLTLIQSYLDEYINENGMDQNLHIVKKNIARLADDFKNFLDTEKIEMGKILYEADEVLNISEYLDDILILFSQYVRQKEISLVTDIKGGIHVRSSREAFDRIINNLMDNAYKFTGKSGRITVVLSTDGNEARLAISDNGIGIPENSLKNITLPYHQITHNKGNSQGMGMGLYIVCNVVDHLGGSLKITSKENQGSCFEIFLPLADACKNGISHERNSGNSHALRLDYPEPLLNIENEKYDPSKKTIMIVEDNNNLLAYLVRSLRKEYNVLFADNAVLALKMVSEALSVDIIISDIMMDIMDGYRFYEELKKSGENGGIPFIFLTAKTSSDDRITGLSLGAIDFITKPFTIYELKAKIKSLLGNIDNIQKKNIKSLKEKVINLFDNDEELCLKRDSFYDEREINRKYKFTEREKQVFHYMIEGKMNKEMASNLSISVSSVKKYIFNIYKKFGVNNRLELNNMLYKNKDGLDGK
jgi:signal transduction histidine kinase/DNA-binding NarL/FixJ family response regulator